jgi:hypothetical protein
LTCPRFFRGQYIYTVTRRYITYKDRHMEKYKKAMRHIKLIRVNKKLFWMHLIVHEVV